MWGHRGTSPWLEKGGSPLPYPGAILALGCSVGQGDARRNQHFCWESKQNCALNRLVCFSSTLADPKHTTRYLWAPLRGVHWPRSASWWGEGCSAPRLAALEDSVQRPLRWWFYCFCTSRAEERTGAPTHTHAHVHTQAPRVRGKPGSAAVHTAYFCRSGWSPLSPGPCTMVSAASSCRSWTLYDEPPI